jgi:hypothetical protein
MMPSKIVPAVLFAVIVTSVAACAPFSGKASIPSSHPEKLPTGRPVCSDCHAENQSVAGAKGYDAFNHDANFVANHRVIAGQNNRVCAVCHAESFCADCHAVKSEIKPATMFGNRPDREQIHQGDYITQHRFDGRADPTGCYSCHGRLNNDTCRQCHNSNN